jgi:hypothetical protein
MSTDTDTDILDDLKTWLTQLIADKPYHEHMGEPEMEIEYVRRAIEEIERLRAAVATDTGEERERSPQ